MSAVRSFIYAAWAVFWLYWLVSAVGVKKGSSSRLLRARLIALPIVVLVGLAIRHVKVSHSLTVHSPALEAVGVVVFVCGLGLAVWARVHLGRNWGMPMTEKADPELVTSGPYHWVRNPIYTGILLGLLGTALAINLYLLIAVVAALGYFVYSATVEERRLAATFPDTYPAYRAHTKMLIPFVL
jgi:protein-S-isoprenylcysteine O-methyltransferase Ste14